MTAPTGPVVAPIPVPTAVVSAVIGEPHAARFATPPPRRVRRPRARSRAGPLRAEHERARRRARRLGEAGRAQARCGPSTERWGHHIIFSNDEPSSACSEVLRRARRAPNASDTRPRAMVHRPAAVTSRRCRRRSAGSSSRDRKRRLRHLGLRDRKRRKSVLTRPRRSACLSACNTIEAASAGSVARLHRASDDALLTRPVRPRLLSRGWSQRDEARRAGAMRRAQHPTAW
jgi:hypothetical protein